MSERDEVRAAWACAEAAEAARDQAAATVAEERVTPEAIRRQRELGWPEFHPETYCHRCGGRNLTSWSVPSEMWNRAASPRDILCPQCWTRAYEAATGAEFLHWSLLPDEEVPNGRAEERVARQEGVDAERLHGILDHACIPRLRRVQPGVDHGTPMGLEDRLLDLVARYEEARMERDGTIAASQVRESSCWARGRDEYRARAEAAEARVATLEADRDAERGLRLSLERAALALEGRATSAELEVPRG